MVCQSRQGFRTMSGDLVLKSSCVGCGSNSDLYGSNCKHLTLCQSCGKTMAETRSKCYECGTPITRLIREYNVRANVNTDKTYYISRFVMGLPGFSRKKNGDVKWTLQKEGLQGRQVTESLREKFKNKPWLLEDETGQHQYHGQLEGAQSATYYLLTNQGKEFVAIPAGSWYNFNKVAQYKQLTLEEAEEKMKNRRKNAEGYERWIMKAANNGASAFRDMEKIDGSGGNGGASGGRRRKGSGDEDDDAVRSDREGEDDDDEEARKNRLGLNKKTFDDEGEEVPRGDDHDFDDDDIEKGDDWEHEEIFTDDDEAVGNDPEEREDFAPEVPAPPEIKQDDEDEDEGNEDEEGGLSKSGRELKKLLGRAGGLNESDGDDDDDDDDLDDDMGTSSVLAPKQKEVKEEPVDNSPTKTATSGSNRGTPSTSKSTKAKRKSGSDDAKPAASAPSKKPKIENDSKPATTVKDEPASAQRSNTPVKLPSSSGTKPAGSPVAAAVPVTEDEIRAVLLQMAPVTTQDLVGKFKARLRTKEDKDSFAAVLKKISRIQKTNGGANFVVLRDK
ncbi:hypothetical protein AMTR_s00061p00167160 [Amborella trichopoda]|uniref:Transcription initiation factor IIF subunit alpha n=2 Tax=Amborella trichopoda TaxID=13333 RepID=U5DCM0_AMBTC|nr:hypothetical protein AMTR_s00061p00167160 [Amborella trichopoda]